MLRVRSANAHLYSTYLCVIKRNQPILNIIVFFYMHTIKYVIYLTYHIQWVKDILLVENTSTYLHYHMNISMYYIKVSVYYSNYYDLSFHI